MSGRHMQEPRRCEAREELPNKWSSQFFTPSCIIRRHLFRTTAAKKLHSPISPKSCPETGLYKNPYQLLQPYGSFADFHGTPFAAECMIFRQLKSEMGKS